MLTAAQLTGLMPQLFKRAFNLTRAHDRAEDLAQATALRCWEKRATFHDGTNPRAWAFTIMRNLRLDELRRQALSPLVENDPSFEGEEVIQPVTVAPTQEWAVAWHQLPQVLSPERLDLTLRHAHLVAFGYPRRFEEKSIKSLAQDLGVREGTVRSRLSRNKAIVREAYAR